ncbi:hypothetical protein [Calothrix sp. UHCC 0171]|uniref:hypothetical protein n=1 Tax=Calothrix sp. UHCC 0171 TaxID=3110245 RepID=UPI002B21AD61|nr:hypothetical protein [Calothrix sp. UHCC 0171]MEA5572903.1 hypothetical protein [Calothrix sp. UHCC 0171]
MQASRLLFFKGGQDAHTTCSMLNIHFIHFLSKVKLKKPSADKANNQLIYNL